MYRNHGKGSTQLVNVGGKNRVHCTFEDGVECVEEYDRMMEQLLIRRWKSKNALGKEKNWEYEIGEAPQDNPSTAGIASNYALNPIFVPRDTQGAWEWRIRNLPYAKHNYSVSIDHQNQNDGQSIVLRTANKKYYKKFQIPSMCRKNLTLEEHALSFTHSNNTLVIQYDKPEEILAEEAKLRQWRREQK